MEASMKTQYYHHQMHGNRGDFLMMHGYGGDFLKPYGHHHLHHYNHRPQPFSLSSSSRSTSLPPLLPLPAASQPAFRSLPTLAPALSLARGRSHLSLSPPKATKPNNNKSKHNNNNNKKVVKHHQKSKATPPITNDIVAAEPLAATRTKRVGPHPESLPKEMTTRVLMAPDMNSDDVIISLLSPPPSSLPLPKFSLRKQQQPQPQPQPLPLLSCTAEAEVAQGGAATNNLYRLLRLR